MNSLCTPSSSSASSPCLDLCTPPPSQQSFLQVPDVFVIPPEEEHGDNPPFCYYDAASETKQALSVGPDIEAVDVALSFYQQTENRAPVFHRFFGNESQETIVMPRRGETKSREGSPEETSRKGGELKRSALDDSDVIEVVKVRRNDGVHHDVENGHPLKKSRSFRARASQAFKSIRNLNKASRNFKPPKPEYDTENMELDAITEDGMHPSRPATPSLSRRKSVQLSQLFTSRSSRFSGPEIPPSPTLSEWSTLSRPSLTLGDRTNSPSPSLPADESKLSAKRSFRRRISVLNLKRVFTPSMEVDMPVAAFQPSGSQPDENIPASASTSIRFSKRDSLSRSRSRSSSTSSVLRGLSDVFSNSSSSSSDTKTFSLPTSFAQSSSTSFASSSHLQSTLLDDDVDMDENLELRLDSLHFDSLHFDPEEFDLTDL